MSASYRPHTTDTLTCVFQLVEQYGPALSRIAAETGLTVGQVAGIKRRHRGEWNKALEKHQPNDLELPPEVLEQRKEGDTVDVRSKSTKIKTVEDLLNHIEADLDNYDVVFQSAKMNECVTKHPETGETAVTPYHQLWVKLRLKSGVPWKDIAEVMIETALRDRKPPAVILPPKPANGVWQVVPVADPHFGKYAWCGTTGYADYDLEIARNHVTKAGYELLAWGDNTFKVARRTLAFLGDVFHYDTPNGTTTSGTPLERDGRMPKMVDVGTDTVLALIEQSARTAPTDVLFVRGNHDEALTTFLQKSVRLVFQNDPRVTVDDSHTHRKYLYHSGTLLGFTHGDKAKKRLPALMPHEAKEWWPQAIHYEWHSGHTHAMKAEWQRPIEYIDGVLVRVSSAICPPDDWHSDHGFTNNLRAMESFIYRHGGGFLDMRVSSPDYGLGTET